MTRVAGDTALITCVVTQREDRSVLWRREGAGQGAGLLAVNTDVVTADPRVSVLHEAGGEVWVLQLRGLAPADSGTYSCELNTAPPTVSRHRVLVLPRLPRSRVGDTEDTEAGDYVDPEEALETVDAHLSAHQPHMTACCGAGGVASSCAGLCDLDHMFHASPAATAPLLARCSAHLATVYRCLADGRDHAPCCLDSGVPELCADFCSGDLAPSNLTSTSTSLVAQCAPYTRQVVGCVAIGNNNNIHITVSYL